MGICQRRHSAPYAPAIAVALAVMIGLAAMPAGAAEDPREVQGRTLFAKGNYQEALDIFAVLFAEKADPVYLRNIGRCYQQLGQPDKAIRSFREYLRRSRPKPAEREEVEGFIREMEELKRARPTERESSPGTAEARPAPPAPLPQPTVAQAPPPPAALVSASSASPHSEDAGAPEPPLTHRWWFWAAIGAVVVGGVITAVALSAGGGSPQGCPADFVCPP